MDDATLKRYARLFHEAGRLTVNVDREKPFGVEPDWDKRSDEQKEIDLRGVSAVAARAVSDAHLEAAAIRKQLVAFSIHMPSPPQGSCRGDHGVRLRG
jgi:hypothetical protein